MNPATPTTFWSFRYALEFISKRSSEPPLGLLTVAALLPAAWEKKLVDMNVTSLNDEDLSWADMVFLGGTSVQKQSFRKVLLRAKRAGVAVVAGGPLVTLEPGNFPEVDHLVLNEAEITLPRFLSDLAQGRPQKVYTSDQYPDLTSSPTPLWSLLDRKKYATMTVQYSRGCPFDCEFCNITTLNGRRPRTKSSGQFIGEIQTLYDGGWRGSVFIVDDNFIGNKGKLKSELLPALVSWSQEHGYPFTFTTEVSINAADDNELLSLMAHSGFDHLFVGIETVNSDSLEECGKRQNLKRNLIQSVRTFQRTGMTVSGGFIVGFDNDPPDIFDRQVAFIQESGIPTAMVGLLTVPTGTRLYDRMEKENRLVCSMSGNNMDGKLNFVPRMDPKILVEGYKSVLTRIYSAAAYYARVKLLLSEYRPILKRRLSIKWNEVGALFRSIWALGIRAPDRRYYWRLFALGLFRYPKAFGLAITMAIQGYHFSRVVDSVIA